MWIEPLQKYALRVETIGAGSKLMLASGTIISKASNVIFRSRRRAASAPATGFTERNNNYDNQLAANTARVIADHAQQDTEAIAATSRKNDREFMHEVSTKMANLAVNANLPPMPLYSREATPHIRGRTPLPSAALGGSGYLRRDITALTPEDNSDIITYLNRNPCKSVEPSVSGHHHPAHVRPASPLPISFRSRPSVPRWYPISPAYFERQQSTAGRPGAAVPRGGSATPSFPVGLSPTAPSAERKKTITDSVVGVVRTSLYGDIVIGIPCNKQYQFNAQHELDDLDNISRSSFLNRTNNPTHFAHNGRTSNSTPFDGASHHLNRASYRRASYAGPTGGLVHGNRPSYNCTIVPQSTNRHAPLSRAGDFDDNISMKSYPGVFVGGRYASAIRSTRRPFSSHKHKVDDIENQDDALDFNDESAVIGELSSLKRNAKSILSRYCLPPTQSTTTTNAPKHVMTAQELDKRYGQILSSMQAKNQISTRSDYSTLLLPPYPSPPRKPEMSDTRRMLRELLCRSKNDPHYFDS